MSEYQIRDSGGLAILAQACACLDRAEESARIIAEQGAVVETRNGLKEHPLLRHEIAARGMVGRMLQRLHLDVEPLKAVGRPGSGGLGWLPTRSTAVREP